MENNREKTKAIQKGQGKGEVVELVGENGTADPVSGFIS
jgi:hypothetical protein